MCHKFFLIYNLIMLLWSDHYYFSVIRTLVNEKNVGGQLFVNRNYL